MTSQTFKSMERAALIAAGIAIGILLGFLYSEWLGCIANRSLESSLEEAEQRAILAEVSAADAFVKAEASGRKVYELERLIVSEKSASEDFKRRLGAEARRYKNLERSVMISLKASVDSVFIPIDTGAFASTDTACIPTPARFAYKDSLWFDLRGSIVKSPIGPGILIDTLNLSTGQVQIDDVTPRKPLSFKRQSPVVRVSIESPYYEAISFREYTVRGKKKVPLGVKILGAAALFGAGFIANSAMP